MLRRAEVDRPVSAAAYNELVDFVERLAAGGLVQAGPGLESRRSGPGGGIVLALASVFPDLVMAASIQERTPANGGIAPASEVSYIIKALRSPAVVVDTSDPDVQIMTRRFARDQASLLNVNVAALGTICAVVRWPFKGAQKVGVWIAGDEGETERFAVRCG